MTDVELRNSLKSLNPVKISEVSLAFEGKEAKLTVPFDIHRSEESYEIVIQNAGDNPRGLGVKDVTVSRRKHAKVFERNGRLYLLDLGSRNGTMHNDKALKPNGEAELVTRDTFTIGNTSFQVSRINRLIETISNSGAVPFKQLKVLFLMLCDEKLDKQASEFISLLDIFHEHFSSKMKGNTKVLEDFVSECRLKCRELVPSDIKQKWKEDIRRRLEIS